MAKRAAKETNVPLVVALVFFVLTTVTFGVMWYMQYSDQQAKDGEVKKFKDAAAAAGNLAREADLNAKLYRVYIGADEGEDKTSLMAEHKAGDKLSAELKRINDALAKRLGLEDAGKLPAAFQFWSVDAAGKIGDPPAKGLAQVVPDAAKDLAAAAAIKVLHDAGDQYTKQTGELSTATTARNKEQKAFSDLTESLPKQNKAKMDQIIDEYVKRGGKFSDDSVDFRKQLDNMIEEKGVLERDKTRLATQMQGLQEQIASQAQKLAQKQDVFQYDEPQGRVVARDLTDDTVTIDLGSNALVRQGLTFTVLPNDFPARGRQSRVRRVRVPDERGNYKDVERFEPKATIEVVEVLGPNRSRCRVTQEYDKIRDGVAAGDLLYNSVWRKGAADHVALIGIFDVNGDGSDDIRAVIRDLTKMGVPVDAYYDLKERKWVGQITEQTRFLVEGWFPANSAGDPNRDEKTKLLAAMSDAIKVARDKSVAEVGFRDFFPRMGYRVKLDLPVDKLNQATAPYLNRAGEIPPMNPGN